MYDLLLYSLYLLLITSGLVFSIVNRRQLGDFSKYMTILLGMVLLFESFDYIIKVEHANFLNHIYQPIEFTLMVLIYGRVLDYGWFRKVMIPMIVIFWSLSIYLSIFVEGIENDNALSFVMGNFCIVIFAIIFHFQLLSNPSKEERLFRHPFFWINTAHLFFYLGTFFQMGFNAYLYERVPEVANSLMIINYVLNLSLYSLYLVGFTCKQIFKSR